MFALGVIKVCIAAFLIAEMNNMFLLFPHFVSEGERAAYWLVIIGLFAFF